MEKDNVPDGLCKSRYYLAELQKRLPKHLMPLLIKVDDQIAKNEARRLVAPTTTASTPGEKRPRKSVRSDGTARLLTVPAIVQLLEEQEEAKDAKTSKNYPLRPRNKLQQRLLPRSRKSMEDFSSNQLSSYPHSKLPAFQAWHTSSAL